MSAHSHSDISFTASVYEQYESRGVNVTESVEHVQTEQNDSLTIKSKTSDISFNTDDIPSEIVNAVTHLEQSLKEDSPLEPAKEYLVQNLGLCKALTKLPKWQPDHIPIFIQLDLTTVACFVGLHNRISPTDNDSDFDFFLDYFTKEELEYEVTQEAILFALTLGAVLNEQIRFLHKLLPHDMIPPRDMPSSVKGTDKFFHRQHLLHQLSTIFPTKYAAIRTVWFNYL